MTRTVFATLIAFGLATAAAADDAPKGLSSPPKFKEVDRNGDGRINREESSVIDGFDFASADVNGDRVLTRQEFAAAIAPRTDHGTHTGVEPITFEEADRNQDGKVDSEEAAGIAGLDFAAADSDDDRQLSRAEFRTAMLEGSPRG
jgi:hypothetical protein